ncbi:MAG: dephospho-CoA kinase [Verrucomicrobiota bacterium JB024]|nr:dephospho-CoA kinase [Verrucomicrobiota bacterium JB024]
MKLGLTGGIGCGKSTAGGFFEEAGFRRVDCDQIVRELLDGDAKVHAALRERFGEQVILAEGGVDRAAIASVVFHDAEALQWLEKLLHPRVSEAWQGLIASDPEANWCVEIPLLFEKNLEKHFDFTVCLASSEAIQMDRLAAKGLSHEQAKARIQRQLPLEQKISRADFVLFNDGTQDFLRQQVFQLIDPLTHVS